VVGAGLEMATAGDLADPNRLNLRIRVPPTRPIPVKMRFGFSGQNGRVKGVLVRDVPEPDMSRPAPTLATHE
jgi:hypothetical protein